jgi:hypothetical protein
MIVQVKRGTTAEAAARLGLEGTLFIDYVAKKLYLHDGVTVGGTLVNGVSAETVNQLIATALDAFEVTIADITGLETALADTLKTADIGDKVASLVGGKVPAEQLPDPVVVPVKATGAELIDGTDDVKFATAASLVALLADIGFTKDGNGDWKLDPSVVAP